MDEHMIGKVERNRGFVCTMNDRWLSPKQGVNDVSFD
jgi:hypothetical protein